MLPSTLYIMSPMQPQRVTLLCLGGDTFTRNMTDGRTTGRLWYETNVPIFLKKKNVYNNTDTYYSLENYVDPDQLPSDEIK